MTEDELFYAWLDGELEGEAAERVAARVAADPALKKEAEQHRRIAAQLRGAFDPVMSDVSPPRFGSAEVIELQAKRSRPRCGTCLLRRASVGGNGSHIGDRHRGRAVCGQSVGGPDREPRRHACRGVVP